MFRFMEIKSIISRLTKKQKATELNYSDSTYERFRNDIIIQSPCRSDDSKKKLK